MNTVTSHVNSEDSRLFSLPWIGTSLNTQKQRQALKQSMFSLPWIGTSLNTDDSPTNPGREFEFSLPWIGTSLNTL